MAAAHTRGASVRFFSFGEFHPRPAQLTHNAHNFDKRALGASPASLACVDRQLVARDGGGGVGNLARVTSFCFAQGAYSNPLIYDGFDEERAGQQSYKASKRALIYVVLLNAGRVDTFSPAERTATHYIYVTSQVSMHCAPSIRRLTSHDSLDDCTINDSVNENACCISSR